MKRNIQLISTLFCFALGANFLYAADGTWGTSDGNWSDSTKWVGGVIADGAGFSCVGPSIGSVTRVITVDSPRTIGRLSMTSNGRAYQFTGSTITLAGNGVFVPPLIRDVSSGSSGRVIIDCVLDGTEGVRLPDATTGHVVFNAANIYSGITFIYRGTVFCGVPDAIPHGAGKGNVLLTDLGTAGVYAGFLDILTNDITINGLIGTNASCQISSSSAVAGTSTLTVGDGDASGSFDGVIGEALFPGGTRQLAVTKIGNGTQALSGDNTYSGNTTVNGGSLLVNGNYYGYGTTTVNGGIFGGNGLIYGAVIVNAGGAVSAGDSPGILHLGYGGLDLSAGGTNIWDLVANSDSNPGTDFDQIDLQSGPLDVTDSTLLVRLSGSVNTSDAFWSSSHSWSVITSASLSGSSNFKAVKVVGGTPPGTFATANNGSDVVLTFTPGVVPQPPTHVKITKITGAGTGSVTVNYTNTLVGTNYVLQYNTNLNTVNWYPAGNKTAAGTSDSQTDSSASGVQRYYRVYYNYAP